MTRNHGHIVNIASSAGSFGVTGKLYKMYLVIYTIPEGIFEIPVGLDPDIRSQRTQNLGLTKVIRNSNFGSYQSPVWHNS